MGAHRMGYIRIAEQTGEGSRHEGEAMGTIVRGHVKEGNFQRKWKGRKHKTDLITLSVILSAMKTHLQVTLLCQNPDTS